MYFLFLDEAGYYNESKPCDYSASDFFVLGGIMIKEQNHGICLKQFLDFKKSTFPEEVAKLPIHARSLNQIGIKGYNEYNSFLTAEEGRRLLTESYKYVATLPLEAIAVVIDNIEMRIKYTSPINSYQLAYEIMLEKFDRIIKARKDGINLFGTINLSQSNTRLISNLTRGHETLIKNGSSYTDLKHILPKLNIQPTKENSFFELADMVCYAYQRAYYNWICSKMDKQPRQEPEYLSLLYEISKNIKIGHHAYTIENNKEVKFKIFPKPRTF